jgi:hypothetical protein
VTRFLQCTSLIRIELAVGFSMANSQIRSTHRTRTTVSMRIFPDIEALQLFDIWPNNNGRYAKKYVKTIIIKNGM